MQPLGKLPVTFQLQGRNYSEDMHIYPDIPGVIMSWKAAKGLRILPVHYPDPVPDIAATEMAISTPIVESHQCYNPCTDRQQTHNSISHSLRWSDQSYARGRIPHSPGHKFQALLCTHAPHNPICVS